MFRNHYYNNKAFRPSPQPKKTITIDDPNGTFNQFLCFITMVCLLGNALTLLIFFSVYTVSELPRDPVVELIKTTERQVPDKLKNLLIPIIVLASIELLILVIYVSYHTYYCLLLHSVNVPEQEYEMRTGNETIKLRVHDSCFGDSTYSEIILRMSFFYMLWAGVSITQGFFLLRCAIEFNATFTENGKIVFRTMSCVSIVTGIISGLYALRCFGSPKRFDNSLYEAVTGKKK